MNADPGALVLTERIRATPDEVFDFLTDPMKLTRWMGVEAEIEPTPGGKFWLNVTGSDAASGTYLTVDRPNRVVFTWGWEDHTEVPTGSTTVTFNLTADGDHTIVELIHAGLPRGADDEHGKGWAYFFPRLLAIASGEDLPPQNMEDHG